MLSEPKLEKHVVSILANVDVTFASISTVAQYFYECFCYFFLNFSSNLMKFDEKRYTNDFGCVRAAVRACAASQRLYCNPLAAEGAVDVVLLFFSQNSSYFEQNFKFCK